MRDFWLLMNIICVGYWIHFFYKKIIMPKIIEKTTKIIETNPKWITSKIQFYGLHDVDFLLVESPFRNLPSVCVSKNKKLEVLLSPDFLTQDVDELLREALIIKIYEKCGNLYTDKSTDWLSIFCYLLEGNDLYTHEKSE